MPIKDDLGIRMKENYELRAQTYLTRRTPVIIRIDGRAFHTFTKGFEKPFDILLHNAMVSTMEYLCMNIQNVKFGYTQSDEITLVLTDYDTLNTDAWFDYKVQKICSIAASMATLAFNRFFDQEYLDYLAETGDVLPAHDKARRVGAMFDARCFNIPKEEVANCVIWRWIDAKRNSIQMVAQSNFSHKELQGCGTAQLKEMLEEIGDPWEEYPDDLIYGVMCFKNIQNTWICRPAYTTHEPITEIVNEAIE